MKTSEIWQTLNKPISLNLPKLPEIKLNKWVGLAAGLVGAFTVSSKTMAAETPEIKSIKKEEIQKVSYIIPAENNPFINYIFKEKQKIQSLQFEETNNTDLNELIDLLQRRELNFPAIISLINQQNNSKNQLNSNEQEILNYSKLVLANEMRNLANRKKFDQILEIFRMVDKKDELFWNMTWSNLRGLLDQVEISQIKNLLQRKKDEGIGIPLKILLSLKNLGTHTDNQNTLNSQLLATGLVEILSELENLKTANTEPKKAESFMNLTRNDSVKKFNQNNFTKSSK